MVFVLSMTLCWCVLIQRKNSEEAPSSKQLIGEIPDNQQEIPPIQELPMRLSESLENYKDSFQEVLSVMQVEWVYHISFICHDHSKKQIINCFFCVLNRDLHWMEKSQLIRCFQPLVKLVQIYLQFWKVTFPLGTILQSGNNKKSFMRGWII